MQLEAEHNNDVRQHDGDGRWCGNDTRDSNTMARHLREDDDARTTTRQEW